MMADVSAEVIRNYDGIDLIADIDSYVVLGKQLNDFDILHQIRIPTNELDAIKFAEPKLLRAIVHQYPQLLSTQLNPVKPLLYEVKLGSSGRHDTLVMVISHKSIPETLCKKYNVHQDKTTLGMKNARYCLLELIKEAIKKMPNNSSTSLSNPQYFEKGEKESIKIDGGDFSMFAECFNEVLQISEVSNFFFFQIAHGLKTPIGATGLRHLKYLMGTASNKTTLLKQVHVGLILDGGKHNGIFIDLQRIWNIHRVPNVCQRFRTYPVINEKFGSFANISSMQPPAPDYVTNINAYNIQFHQKKQFILRYFFLTMAQLGKENYNVLKKDFLENIQCVIPSYCKSLTEGMPLRIEFVISMKGDVDILNEEFLGDSCSKVLATMFNSKVLIKVKDCSSYGNKLLELFNILLKQYDECQPPLSKVQLTTLCEKKNDFWSKCEGTTYQLSIPKPTHFVETDQSDNDGNQLKYIKFWKELYITEECLPQNLELQLYYKEFLMNMYTHCLCVNNFTDELNMNVSFQKLANNEQLIYQVLLVYSRYARYIAKILPIDQESLSNGSVCPIECMKRDYINEVDNISHIKWYRVLEGPATIAKVILKPNTFEGKMLSSSILNLSKMPSDFQSQITSFLRKYEIDAFPTYLLYGSEDVRKLWSQIWLGKISSIPKDIELSGDLRSQANLK